LSEGDAFAELLTDSSEMFWEFPHVPGKAANSIPAKDRVNRRWRLFRPEMFFVIRVIEEVYRAYFLAD
jgi:hypothetical protein